MSIRIDNDLLRERFQASGMTAYEVAREIGWINNRRTGRSNADSSRVKRYLGIIKHNSGHGYCSYRRSIKLEAALKIAGAIGVDPRDIGA